MTERVIAHRKTSRTNKTRKTNKSHKKRRQRFGSSMIIARQTRGKRQPLVRTKHTFRLKGGRTLVTSGNKLTWGPVDQFGLLPEVNTRTYPNSYTPTWNTGSPYPASL